jgi:ABC-2 type transport system permease protein
MSGLLAYYKEQIKISLIVQFQYRVGMAIWLIDVVLQPTIYMVVWRSAAGGGVISGYSASDFAAYYIVLMAVGHAGDTWNMWEDEYFIRHGELSAKLLRPVHPIHRDICGNISYKLLMSPIIIGAIIFLTLAFHPTLHTPLWVIPLLIPVIALGSALAFVSGWVVALAAFWTTRIMAINQMYFLIMLFFSGELAPLEVLPSALRTLADALPFRWMISFPVELILGQLSFGDVLSGLVMQSLWLVIGVFAGRYVWQMGVKQYSAVGA